MIWWLVDNVNVIYFILGLALLVAGVLFWQNKRVRELVAIFVIVGIGVLVWILCSLVITDRKQVELTMHALARAAVDEKAEEITPHLANDFTIQGRTRSQAGQFAVDQVRTYKINGYSITGFEIEELTRVKDQGHAKAMFGLRVDSAHGSHPLRCRVTYVLETGQWRVRSFKLYHAVGNSETPIYE